MRYAIVLCSPTQFRYTHFLFDTAHALQYALESLGHSVVVSEGQLDGSRLNILLNAHTMRNPGTVEQIHAAKVRYVVHQTEVIKDGFVNGTQDVTHFEQVYLPLLRGAEAVWDWSDPHAEQLRGMGIRAHNLRLGAHPRLREVHHKIEKDVDLLWYGSVTTHRSETLKRLIAAGLRVKAVFDPVAFYRNDLIARTRIVLTLQQAVPSHLPYFRIGYLVNNAVIVAGEAPPEPHWIDPFFDKAPNAGIETLLRGLLDRKDADLRALGEARQERFEAEIPMTASLEPLLAELSGR